MCQSGDLGGAPLEVELMETPVVLFRDSADRPKALIDRCPHRNVPLSLGTVTADGELQCGYHGWCFDGGGRCTSVPGLGPQPASPARSVPSHAVTETDGFVWIWGEADATPTGRPPVLPRLGERRVGRTVFVIDLDCTMHAAIENALDVPHTAFLHGGIFRGRKEPREITAVRRDLPGGVEVQYLGEPLGFGPLTLDRDRTSKTFDHWDRFLVPNIAQVEYAVEGWIRVVNTILHLPLAPFRTRAWFVLDHSSPLPASVAGSVIRLRGRKVLRQDAEILAAQTERIRRFGGERYASSELDLMGNAIWRLLREAERAEAEDVAVDPGPDPDEGTSETTVTLRI